MSMNNIKFHSSKTYDICYSKKSRKFGFVKYLKVRTVLSYTVRVQMLCVQVIKIYISSYQDDIMCLSLHEGIYLYISMNPSVEKFQKFIFEDV